MAHAQALQHEPSHFMKRVALVVLILFAGSSCFAQEMPAGQRAQAPWQDLNKYPGLLEEFGRLLDKLQHNVQYPAPRSESRLLPLLPPSTMSYAAFPNYGSAANQALKIFRQELQENAALRDWWGHGDLATAGPKIEAFVEKFSELHDYLGEEIVMSGAFEGQKPKLLIVAAVRKPGLKRFLEQMIPQLAGKAKPGVRILEPQELATAKATTPGEELLVLVRPDFAVGAFDIATLQSFNAHLDRRGRGFASTPFGQRVAQEYKGGLTILAAADLHTILDQAPPSTKQDVTFQRSGFADMKYIIWGHKNLAGRGVSQMELSFNGPRYGAASWLAKPTPLNSLDFVSPNALMSGTVVLKNLGQIFEDVKELAGPSNAKAFAALPQFEQALNLSLKDDLLSLLGGELTAELAGINPPQQPVWKAILAVKDANHLQQTLSKLEAVAHLEEQEDEEGGISYHTVQIPSARTTTEITYAFADGYLIAGSSRDIVGDAVRLHKSGESLAKSGKFLAALPPGHSQDASALLYYNAIAMTALRMRLIAPEIAQSLAESAQKAAPVVACVYGEEAAIREAGASSGADVGVALVVAAIAIPNLLRSRMAANEAVALGSVRTVNTAQVTYAATYPQRGYATNLATFGVDPGNPAVYSADHAGLIDQTLANESCTADAWCTKSGYRFRVTAICKQQLCREYVVLATPVDVNTGTRSFCSTSDGIIHLKPGPPLTLMLSATECRAWSPLE